MFNNFDDNSQFFKGPNPLDFLAMDSEEIGLKRKPRSSMESSDRQIEIPACQPPYISRHLRDAGRAYEPVESFSPQPVNRKPLFKLGSFMDNDTFEDDVDFLFDESSSRSRVGSDTCFSSNLPEGGSNNSAQSCEQPNEQAYNSSQFEGTSRLEVMLVDSQDSYPSHQVDANVENAVESDRLNASSCMDTNSLIDGLNDSFKSSKETFEDSIDNICLLQPIATTVKVSREGLRKQKKPV